MDHAPSPDHTRPGLEYEPRFDSRNGKLVGAKLYQRASGPAERVIIRSAGPSGLAALDAACRAVAAWNAAHGCRLSLTVGTHLEVMCDPEFAPALSTLLLESRLDPACLELNVITDGIEIPDSCTAALQHLKACGVRFTISAANPSDVLLAWLGRLPVDSLEVPGDLIHNVTTDPEGVAIVRALVARAHKMKLQVNAKGIGTAHAASVMRACGCDYLQGPLFSPTLAGEAFEALLGREPNLDITAGGDGARERTLLLVDDEENILSSLRRLLRRDGYRILTASNAREGLEVLAANRVDVIISDQRMPAMTGVEFLRKAKDMCPDTVRLVLSGYTDLQSVTDAINEGAIYKFLTKPWDDALLRANIDEAFRRKAITDENLRLGNELQRANEELARINERLNLALADRERRLGLDEAVLSLTQEALAVMPLPVLGTDPGGMIALANQAAERLFAGHSPLLGLDAGDVLPDACLPLIAAGAGQAEIDCGTRRFRVVAHRLGEAASPRGCLLTFTHPAEAA